MAVNVTLKLPAQPAIGLVEEVALFGAGGYAPHSEFHVTLGLEGDGSGGTMTLNMQPDARWASVISWVTIALASQAADRIVRFEISAAGSFITGSSGTLVAKALSTDNLLTWFPPPLVLSSPTQGTDVALQVRLPNTDTEDATVTVNVLNFLKDVRTKVPLWAIYASLGRNQSLV